jgi:uncharacterized OsmC-like protein
MAEPVSVRDAIERNVKAVTLRPGVGQGTAVTRVRLGDQLSCEIEDGPWKLVASMTEKYGGTNAGPNPGVYGRAALGSCLAVGYAMWAARLNVPIDRLEVEVHADYDVRGELGVNPDVRPGYLRMRYVVRVDSPAPDSAVLEMLDTAERFSSYLDDFANAVPVERELHLNGQEHR